LTAYDRLLHLISLGAVKVATEALRRRNNLRCCGGAA
jgi:hypothetical protein